MRAFDCLAAAALVLAGTLIASDQKAAETVAFTIRNSFDCPITISSFAQSKAYGFEYVMLRNEGDVAVTAADLLVTLRTDGGDETVEERRISVDIAARDMKRVAADLGHVEGLGQKVKSARREQGLAILTVTSLEFADGSLWQPRPTEGAPDLAPPARLRK
jgi:hypothetical protein